MISIFVIFKSSIPIIFFSSNNLESFRFSTPASNEWGSLYNLKEHGHEILVMLKKLDPKCCVKIEIEKIMSFSKKGTDVSWTTYQDVENIVCKGEPDCDCQNEDQEPKKKRAK